MSRIRAWTPISWLKFDRGSEIAEHKAIILSTHLMQEVQALCDRVIIINQGKLVADKKLSELQELHGSNLEEAFAYYTSQNANTSE